MAEQSGLQAVQQPRDRMGGIGEQLPRGPQQAVAAPPPFDEAASLRYCCPACMRHIEDSVDYDHYMCSCGRMMTYEHRDRCLRTSYQGCLVYLCRTCFLRHVREEETSSADESNPDVSFPAEARPPPVFGPKPPPGLLAQLRREEVAAAKAAAVARNARAAQAASSAASSVGVVADHMAGVEEINPTLARLLETGATAEGQTSALVAEAAAPAAKYQTSAPVAEAAAPAAKYQTSAPVAEAESGCCPEQQLAGWMRAKGEAKGAGKYKGKGEAKGTGKDEGKSKGEPQGCCKGEVKGTGKLPPGVEEIGDHTKITCEKAVYKITGDSWTRL